MTSTLSKDTEYRVYRALGFTAFKASYSQTVHCCPETSSGEQYSTNSKVSNEYRQGHSQDVHSAHTPLCQHVVQSKEGVACKRTDPNRTGTTAKAEVAQALYAQLPQGLK